jgi:hypothetical protein
MNGCFLIKYCRECSDSFMKVRHISLLRNLVLALALAFGINAGTSAPAIASSGDHDQARAALESGEILPLSAILLKLEKDFSGQIVEVELEREHGQWIYEIKLLQKDGYRQKLKVDAKNAAVISKKIK